MISFTSSIKNTAENFIRSTNVSEICYKTERWPCHQSLGNLNFMKIWWWENIIFTVPSKFWQTLGIQWWSFLNFCTCYDCSSLLAHTEKKRSKAEKKERVKEYLKELKSMVKPDGRGGTLSTLQHVLTSMRKIKGIDGEMSVENAWIILSVQVCSFLLH